MFSILYILPYPWWMQVLSVFVLLMILVRVMPDLVAGILMLSIIVAVIVTVAYINYLIDTGNLSGLGY